jgi:hypothetical protein
MIVCSCNVFTDHDVRETALAGATIRLVGCFVLGILSLAEICLESSTGRTPQVELRANSTERDSRPPMTSYDMVQLTSPRDTRRLVRESNDWGIIANGPRQMGGAIG